MNQMPKASNRNRLLNATNQVPSAKLIFSAAATVAATGMLVRSFAREFVPRELRDYLFLKIKDLVVSFTSEMTFVIEEYDGLNQNHLYSAAEIYLEPIISPDAKRIRVVMPKKEGKFSLSLEKNEEIIDHFNGAQVNWKFVSKNVRAKHVPVQGPDSFRTVLQSESRFFELCFDKKHKDMIMSGYLQQILSKAKDLMDKKKTLQLFTLKNDRMMYGRGTGDTWQSVNLDHPATFQTLAMDSELKKKIMDDLKRFVERKEYYRRIGKAWKRGYLLFGPPGTGKSSLIAAIANYLNFDIYDLELTDIKGNLELRKLLITTGNKSIIVVEDIDCSLEFQDRLAKSKAEASKDPHRHDIHKYQLTLSGLLNFIDGLWSSCGDERIIVFTTNHKDRLDPALLRPGRMDVHIHMSYCTPCAFKTLAFNYLGITEHPLFLEIEQLLEKKKVTPAEVAEQLMKDEVPQVVLSAFVEFLEAKLEGCPEAEVAESLSGAFHAVEGEKQEMSKKITSEIPKTDTINDESGFAIIKSS